MAKQIINVGARNNDGTGDSLRAGATKVNDNFSEIYNLLGDGESLSVVSRINAGQGLTVSNSTGVVLITGTIASNNDLGMIKIGENLTISQDGTLSAQQTTYTLPTASSTVLGGVKVGTGLSINQGVLSANSPTPYTLPIATSSIRGGVKVGANLSVTADGTISGHPDYLLPTATDSILGGIKIGAGLSISNGVVSVTIPTNSIPSQANNSGKYLTTDGTNLSWATVSGGNASTGDFTFSEDTITNNDGMKLTTNRGTLAMGTNMEVPGVAGHFHIAFDGSNSNPPASDLFLGDDHNYVKLPGYELEPTAQFGVEIGTDNRNLGPQNIEVFTVDELVPPGGVWRLFIDHETYPNLGSAVSVGDTVTTSWGTPITATITAVIEEPGNNWKIHVAQNITAGFIGYDTVSFGSSGDSHTWRFGTDGALTAPGDIKTGVSGGRFIQDCDDGTTSMRWINVTVESESTQLIRAYSGDPDGEGNSDERAQIKLNWQDEDRSGLTIRAFDRTDPEDTVSHDWNFSGDGDLYIPPGKTIRDAMTGDDLLAGGGTAGDANIWVQTFVSDTPLTDFPQIATSVEYDADGNVIGLFNHFDDNSSASYFSVGKYTPSGTKIWTARLSDEIQTDGWGLAVDPVDGWIYVAGQSDGTTETYPYRQATLTKIDPANGSYDWHKVYDFGYDSASAVVDVDSSGNPIMVGYVDVGGNSNESYLAVTKINKTDGSVTWSRKLDGQADEQAYGMAVGPNNEVVAVGFMDQLGVVDGVATLYADNNPNWTGGSLAASTGGVTFSVTVTAGVATFSNISDTWGNRSVDEVIATIDGQVFGGEMGVDDMVVKVGTLAANDTDDRIVVVKYNSAGAIQWQKAIQFDSGFDCTGADADIDSQGNVYICGQHEIDGGGGPGGTGMALIKFNSAGVKLWSRRVVGDCISVATSIVVGPDDKLYISGVNGNDFATTFVWVVAKYSLDGLVEWQRFVENTTTWTFSGQLFNNSAGGSNLAVRQDYVALAGGFGDLEASEQVYATLVQVPATGTVFTVGNWDFKAATLSGVLNSSASDIVVIDAGLADSDNAGAIEVGTIGAGDTEVGNFLIGTLYTAPGGNDSLVNGSNQLVLESTGTLTLPQGGTITEGYVTSNPTIQLAPASPDVASQKLVIKGGGSYSNTENGIYLSTNNITWAVSTTVEFYVYDPTRANETLYWWIVPEGAGISTTMSGTVALDGIGDGNFTFTLDSDAYEFRVRVSPEDNNYDPNNTGVESVLINGDEPTFEGEHHLHLTTGDLSVTSIFLGTDDHNVRTTTNGKIQITTPNTVNKVWEFDTAGTITLPQGGVISETYANDGHSILLTPYAGLGNNPDMAVKIYPTFNDDDHIHITAGNPATVDLFLGDDDQYVKIEADGGNIVISADDPADVKWTFGTNGKLSKLGGVTLTAGGQFNICTIVNPGSGYTGDDPLPATTTTTGNGTGMTVNFGYGIAGQLTSVDVSNPGTGYVNGDVISVAGGSGNFILTQYNVLGNQANSNFAQSEWTFSPDGGLTFPNSTVQTTAYTGITTVAKTGTIPATVGTRLVTGFTIEPTYDAGWVNSYSVSIAGFSCDINFPSAGNPVFGNIVDTAGNRTVGDILTTVLASNIGGTVDMVLKVGAVSEIVVATAIDLTKSVNKLTDGVYTLANGVEGQIMYLVAQNGVVEANVSVLVANSRNIGVGTLSPFSVYDNSDDSYYDNIGGICTLIFTDGAWQQSGGAWGTPT